MRKTQEKEGPIETAQPKELVRQGMVEKLLTEEYWLAKREKDEKEKKKKKKEREHWKNDKKAS